MKKVPMPKHVFERPKFSWIKCCNKCPSQFPADPESLEYFSRPYPGRMDTTFACAWRLGGNCYLNQKKTFYGNDTIV